MKLEMVFWHRWEEFGWKKELPSHLLGVSELSKLLLFFKCEKEDLSQEGYSFLLILQSLEFYDSQKISIPLFFHYFFFAQLLEWDDYVLLGSRLIAYFEEWADSQECEDYCTFDRVDLFFYSYGEWVQDKGNHSGLKYV